MNDLKKVEALLFVASEGININELVDRTNIRESRVLEMIKKIQQNYENMDSAIKIHKYPNGLFRMTVDRSLLDKVSDIAPTEFSKSLIRTLAVIAWKKGIKQSEVVKIRGNKSYNHINKLEELGFINSKDYKRTKKIYLTDNFYEYFNITKGEEKFLFDEDFSKNRG